MTVHVYSLLGQNKEGRKVVFWGDEGGGGGGGGVHGETPKRIG